MTTVNTRGNDLLRALSLSFFDADGRLLILKTAVGGTV